jgi:hypothetical protein
MTQRDVRDAEMAMELGRGSADKPSPGILIGYARCSTERVYLDHSLTGRNRSRPGLNNAMAALREGDTLVVPKLDRLARSVPDARAIGDSLATRGVQERGAQAQPDPTDGTTQTPPGWRALDRRARGVVLCQPRHRVPRDRANTACKG